MQSFTNLLWVNRDEMGIVKLRIQNLCNSQRVEMNLSWIIMEQLLVCCTKRQKEIDHKKRWSQRKTESSEVSNINYLNGRPYKYILPSYLFSMHKGTSPPQNWQQKNVGNHYSRQLGKARSYFLRKHSLNNYIYGRFNNQHALYATIKNHTLGKSN